MLHQLICFILLLIATDISDTLKLPDGITVHKVKAEWSEAQLQCESEGLVIASPTNEKIINIIQSVIGLRNTSYYIGTRAHDTAGQYVSVEGIPLENMTEAMVNMIDELDRSQGDCLAMNHDSIRVVSCRNELPYICYNTEIYNINSTNCGPIEQGYKYEMATGSCYKIHEHTLSWDDAQRACDDEDGHLVIIDNEVEDRIVKKMCDFANYGWIFVGLRDLTGYGEWISVHWQRVENLYNVWADSAKPAQPNTRCGTINYQGALTARSCDEQRYFVCEK